MAGDLLTETIAFDPADPTAALAEIPHAAAVFALYFAGAARDGSSTVERSADARVEPYIGRTPNLRARLERLLLPSPKHPRRLQLAGRVRRIAWRFTGSDFESLLAQFSLLEEVYAGKALERMHLGAPAFIRFLGSNAHPRITITNRPNLREADWSYGPFQSRAAAEHFADEALKLFLLRRCTDDLDPNPAHPGCVYSEMKMCLAPCYQGCTDERYREEASAVEGFLATRGESRLVTLRTERDQASTELAFEAAAALHAQVQRVETVRALAPELVRPLNQLRAVILQASARPDEVAVFLFENGRLRGPAAFSTMGMRIQNDQSGSSSLFAQPMAIEPILEPAGTRDEGNPTGVQDRGIQDRGIQDRGIQDQGPGIDRSLIAGERQEGTSGVKTPAPLRLARGLLESRMEAALAELAEPGPAPSTAVRQGHLALLKRWYYRPENRRTGEIFFPDGEGHWPAKSLLRGVGRVAAKMLVSHHA